MWKLLVQGIWSGQVQWTQADCGAQGFASTDGFASAGETEQAPGRQTAYQLLSQHLQSAHFWYQIRLLYLLHDKGTHT